MLATLTSEEEGSADNIDQQLESFTSKAVIDWEKVARYSGGEIITFVSRDRHKMPGSISAVRPLLSQAKKSSAQLGGI